MTQAVKGPNEALADLVTRHPCRWEGFFSDHERENYNADGTFKENPCGTRRPTYGSQLVICTCTRLQSEAKTCQNRLAQTLHIAPEAVGIWLGRDRQSRGAANGADLGSNQ